MQSRFQTFNHRVWRLFSSTQCQLLIRLILMALLMVLWRYAFADDADPLAGTEGGLVKTLGSGGTGRKFIYMIEGVAAIATYIKTKNILMLTGVVAIAIFLNILFTVAGIG